MKEIVNKNDIIIIRKFDRDDFIKNPEFMNEAMNIILASYEKSNEQYNETQAMELLDNFNADFFLEEDNDGKVYILYIREKQNGFAMPVGFVIYSKSNLEKSQHVEYITTHTDYTSCGYGEYLLTQSAKDLARCGYKNITSIVNKDNHASHRMHQRFCEDNNISLIVDNVDFRKEYIMNIENINVKANESEQIL